MADERIYQWTNEPTPQDDVIIPIDHPDWSEGLSTTKAQLFADEVAARTAWNNAIIDGSGLDADGSFPPEPTSDYLQNIDFINAGLDVNTRNGLILLDRAISASVSNNQLIVKFVISSAELLALNSTPVLKVIAPGIGNIFETCDCMARNNFASVPYVTAGTNGIYVRFESAADFIAHLDKVFCESAVDVVSKFPIGRRHDLPTNVGIEVYAPDGDLINGDGSITVLLRYAILPEPTPLPLPIKTCCVQPLADSFTNADLTGLGNLVINHGQNTTNIFLIVIDNTNTQFPVTFTSGDEGGADPNNYITVPIGGGIAGTWKWAIIAY